MTAGWVGEGSWAETMYCSFRMSCLGEELYQKTYEIQGKGREGKCTRTRMTG